MIEKMVMIERGHDTAMADILTAYDARVSTGEVVHEHVSVTLSRACGFQNIVNTGSGHLVIVDEPENFGGQGAAADPAELLLAALGASLSVTITAHAALRGITIESLSIELGGWMAAESFFRPDGDAEAGMQGLTAKVRVISRSATQQLEALVHHAVRASPVAQSLVVPPRVELVSEVQA